MRHFLAHALHVWHVRARAIVFVCLQLTIHFLQPPLRLLLKGTNQFISMHQGFEVYCPLFRTALATSTINYGDFLLHAAFVLIMYLFEFFEENLE